MEIESKVCLTTFIYGEKYQYYIPLLIYSLHKSYPEYGIVLFVYGNLDESIRLQVDELKIDNLHIIENYFSDCPHMNPRISQCLRWVIWDDMFLSYDFIYVIDVDMLYIREPQPLHLQHLCHMESTSLPFDNMKRAFYRNPYKISSVLQRIKHAGLRNFSSFLFSEKLEFRLTGLHFIDVRKYYRVFTREKIDYYKYKIYDGSWLDCVFYPNDEVYLYYILKELGMHPEKVASQTDSVISLDFNNCKRQEFRPHHGIHLGIFRSDLSFNKRITDVSILNSSAYSYYIDKYKNDYLNDMIFAKLLRKSPNFIQASFLKLNDYYNIVWNY